VLNKQTRVLDKQIRCQGEGDIKLAPGGQLSAFLTCMLGARLIAPQGHGILRGGRHGKDEA